MIDAESLNKNIMENRCEDNLVYKSIGNYDSSHQTGHKKSGGLGLTKSIATPITCSTLLSTSLDEHIWFMQVEDFFFSIAINHFGQNDIKIPLNNSEVFCSNMAEFSPLHTLLRKYQKVMNN